MRVRKPKEYKKGFCAGLAGRVGTSDDPRYLAGQRDGQRQRARANADHSNPVEELVENRIQFIRIGLYDDEWEAKLLDACVSHAKPDLSAIEGSRQYECWYPEPA